MDCATETDETDKTYLLLKQPGTTIIIYHYQSPTPHIIASFPCLICCDPGHAFPQHKHWP